MIVDVSNGYNYPVMIPTLEDDIKNSELSVISGFEHQCFFFFFFFNTVYISAMYKQMTS